MSKPKVIKEDCFACGTCLAVCPMIAITITEHYAIIDESKCTNCRLCEKACPVKAIR